MLFQEVQDTILVIRVFSLFIQWHATGQGGINEELLDVVKYDDEARTKVMLLKPHVI